MEERELSLIQLMVDTVRETTKIVSEIRSSLEQMQAIYPDIAKNSKLDDIKGIIIKIDSNVDKLIQYISRLGDQPFDCFKDVNNLIIETRSLSEKIKKLHDYVYDHDFQRLIQKLNIACDYVTFLHSWARVRLPFVIGGIMFIFSVFGYWLMADNFRNQIETRLNHSLVPVVEKLRDVDDNFQRLEKELSAFKIQYQTSLKTIQTPPSAQSVPTPKPIKPPGKP